MFPELLPEQQVIVTEAIQSRNWVIERTLLDYYRCPEHFVKMSWPGTSRRLSYFRFGSDICTARVLVVRSAESKPALVDVLPNARRTVSFACPSTRRKSSTTCAWSATQPTPGEVPLSAADAVAEVLLLSTTLHAQPPAATAPADVLPN
jgi:hypothetical protein